MAEESSKEKSEVHSKNTDVTTGRGYQRIHAPISRMLLNNLLGGIAWGFGTVLGATLVVALVVLLLTKLNSVPIIGDFFSNILQTIQQGSK
jgi:hypothetical protein